LTPDESKLEIHARIRQAEKWFLDQNWKQAAPAFREITELAEDDEIKEFAHRQAGVSYYHLGQLDDAEKELTAQIQIAPTGTLAPYSRFLLGMIASRLAETAPPREAADLASKARVAFSDALTGARTAKDHRLVLTILSQAAAILEKYGKARLAETYYQEILAESKASQQERLDAHEALARLCLKGTEPRHAKAIEHLSTMLPACAGVRAERVRFVLGQCYRALDQTENALECFEKLAGAAQTPDLAARSLYEVGCCRERLSQSEKALDVWYDLITRYPAHERIREVEGKLQDALQRHLRNKKL
jgi:TolA-binding protein